MNKLEETYRKAILACGMGCLMNSADL